MKFLLTLFYILILAVPCYAQYEERVLKKLLSADDAAQWSGVGRINFGGRSSCTGVLIEKDRVLTAAHCLFDSRTTELHKPENITYLAGWRKGQAVAYRKARRVVVHEDYIPVTAGANATRSNIANDIAVIELDLPIDISAARPFSIQSQPRQGTNLTVVSYGRGRNEVATLESGCSVISRDSRVLMSDCEATFGTSGAPIFVVDEGVPRVASIISAIGESNGVKRSFGVALGQPLDELMLQLSLSRGVFKSVSPSGKSLAEQLGRE